MKLTPKTFARALVALLTLIVGSSDHGCLATKNRSVKKMILLDRTPVLPDKVRLLSECTDGSVNCTRTCPDSYTIDAQQQYCRPKRQDGAICPPGYVQRSGAGGAGGCVLEDISCPPGSAREGNRCVVRTYSCPAGYVQRGTSCVRDNICQAGFRYESGLCFPASARIFCPPGFSEQHPGGNCAPSACSDCCDCRDEVAGTICPAGYANQWGRCVRHQQASPDLRIQSVTYRLPVECGTGQTFNGGQCESFATVGRAVCRVGHLYNGSCVAVAKCARGTLNNVCSCELEQHVASSCTVGKLQDGLCLLSRAHCRAPARLRNGVCVREVKTRTTCPEGGVPFQSGYCALEVPRCARGFTLDAHGLCRRGSTSCTFECGPYQRLNRWCGLPATCPEGYGLSESGHCVRETVRPAFSCPDGTVDRGDQRCTSVTPLCRSNYRYNPSVDLCTRCDERPVACGRGNLTGGMCTWSEPACPVGHEWRDSMCVRNETRKIHCRKGYEHGEQCVQGELSCPAGFELQGESCVTRDDVHCPEGSYPLDGRCTVAKECPDGFQPGPDACVRESRRLTNASEPTCTDGYVYDGEVCVRRTIVEAMVTRKQALCPDGYEERGAGCVRTVRTFSVCPPRTIYTDRSDRCYCEVDLMCPTGYERTGTDCTFRAAGFTSLVNFLSPCYGAYCGGGGAYCITQCTFPPCPFEPCAMGTAFGPRPTRCLTPGAGDEDCPPQTVIGLVCPPGYERVNSSCLAYYDKVCPDGYDLHGDEDCARTVRVSPVCPAGYHREAAGTDGGSCIQATCPNGFKLTGTGTTCEKRELRSPKACPPGWDFFQGGCYRRSLCRNGTIEGAYCVEREYARPTCPDGYIQRGEDCATEGSCRTAGSVLIDGMCVRIAEPAACPDGTYRHGRHCVYPDAPECEDVAFTATDCTSEVDSSGLCWRRAAPTCPQGYRLRDDRCVACQTEKPNCPADMTIRQEVCIAERTVCPAGHFLRNGQCVTLHVTRPRCPAGEYTLCNGFCIVPYAHECKGTEHALATCSRGFQFRGNCVEHGRCSDPDQTLVDGECQLRTYSDSSCHGKGSRIGELCVGGTPQCPPNYALIGGRCYSRHIENAQCAAGGGTCSDSFCQLETPRCSSSGAIFDGRNCQVLTTSKPLCPTGTTPDRYEPKFCQLKSERAVYNCPAEYHYQNGVCLKKLYKNPSCPVDYKLRNGACVKRVCTRMSTGVSCLDASPATTIATSLSCAQCLNDTASSSGGPQWAATQETVDLCCMVYSPRICRDTGECHHERERVCGSFCLTEDDRIYLTVSRSVRVGTRFYVAPRPRDDDGDDYDEDDDDAANSGDGDGEFRECSRCLLGPGHCPKHCSTYDCEEDDDGEGCNYKEAANFCAQYRGAKLCEQLRHFG